ncbi:MAG TPA: glycosyl hydrolase family protein [Bacteroidota bacterium]|nr:glycosyl hydrolase family protein [Bacteroidota bacterium]
MPLKRFGAIVHVLILTAGVVFAQSPVTLSINTQTPGYAIPDDFSGISLEMGALKSGNSGTPGYMFDDTTVFPAPSHKQVLTLFLQLGLKHVRVGGGSVDQNIVPANADIDAFFRFVKLAGVKVAYSVRLLNGNITDDTNIVKYVWSNYQQYIDCFSIGNEPDFHSYHNSDPEIFEATSGVTGSAYPSYVAKWNRFAAAITTAVPDAKLSGPDTGSNYPASGGTNTSYNGKTWTANFAADESSSGFVKSVYFHNYVGQSASGSNQLMIDNMLSTTWVSSNYPTLYNASGATATSDGLLFRLTESNSYSGAVKGASNSFATALFALDYMHWWAEHGAEGVNFHNKQWVGNGPIYIDGNLSYQVYPVGYGIKAFDLGGHGSVGTTTITNPDGLNLTAYAVQDTGSLYVTVINKEHNAGARAATVTISAEGFSRNAKVVFLKSPTGVFDTSGVTLGGAPITNSGPWQGVWQPIDSVRSGNCYITVPASTAAVVKIDAGVTSVPKETLQPDQYELFQNYPNPFNPSTVITYRLPAASQVRIKIFDALGREVSDLIDQRQTAGEHSVTFNAQGFGSGVYFCRFMAGSYNATMKMVLLK